MEINLKDIRKVESINDLGKHGRKVYDQLTKAANAYERADRKRGAMLALFIVTCWDEKIILKQELIAQAAGVDQSYVSKMQNSLLAWAEKQEKTGKTLADAPNAVEAQGPGVFMEEHNPARVKANAKKAEEAVNSAKVIVQALGAKASPELKEKLAEAEAEIAAGDVSKAKNTATLALDMAKVHAAQAQVAIAGRPETTVAGRAEAFDVLAFLKQANVLQAGLDNGTIKPAPDVARKLKERLLEIAGTLTDLYPDQKAEGKRPEVQAH